MKVKELIEVLSHFDNNVDIELELRQTSWNVVRPEIEVYYGTPYGWCVRDGRLTLVAEVEGST